MLNSFLWALLVFAALALGAHGLSVLWGYLTRVTKVVGDPQTAEELERKRMRAALEIQKRVEEEVCQRGLRLRPDGLNQLPWCPFAHARVCLL